MMNFNNNMDRSCSSVLLCFLLVLCSCLAEAYVEKFFENDSICSANLVLNEFNLIGHDDQSALVIKDSRYFQSLIGEHELNCRFTVSTSLGLGVFAVIQHMSFRQNAQGECIDYVQFRHIEKTMLFGSFNLKLRVLDPWSSKICGKINNVFEFNIDNNKFSNSSDEDDNKAVKNAFISKNGLIEVQIHLGNSSIIEVDKEPSLEVVFTAFQDCIAYDKGLWKSCGSGTCIHKTFFQDGKLNCPYKNCIDESGCHSPVISVKGIGERLFGIKRLAGFVAGASIILVAFIVFMRLFCYYGATFCCSDQTSNSNSFEMHTVSISDNMQAFTATAPSEVDVNYRV